jgi:two-component system cell cycle response regulator DivK
MLPITTETSTWRILLVDDEPDNLRLAADLLEFYGATVELAGTGQEALDRALAFRPNFVLLDLAMPGLDGWEVHRRLRAMPDFENAPMVALTALAMPTDAIRVREEGFDAYITKPFRVKSMIDQLADCVRTFLASKAANQPPAANQEKTDD